MMRTSFIRPRVSIDWHMTKERDCPKDSEPISIGITEMLIHNKIRSLHRACRTTCLAWVLLTGALASAQTDTDIPTRGEIKEVQQRLRASYDILTLERPASTEAAVPLDESQLAKPEQRALAIASNASYVAPGELRSQGGILRATLVVTKAYNTIGEDAVFLRSYNGNLVGPTLRASPGDVLYITVKNDLAPEPTFTGNMNTLHGFNTTNLHTHGLHVSPSGISDNVLLTIAPGATQQYEIRIPKDHDAGTFWYHAHVHGSTAAQVSSGMGGMLIIDGGVDEVPEISEAQERVFVLQQISYYNEGLKYGVIEEQYADKIFGPGKWNKLGRYTTVNGIQIPVLKMVPGSVERWRFVHAGVREDVLLKLIPSTGTGPALRLHEIAVDGLSLGKVQESETVELWPGYRSDVMVQAPATPGEYLLIDEKVAANEALEGEAVPRKYIARLVVAGTPKPMELPKSSQLTKYRRPTLTNVPANEVGTQTAHYAIIAGPRFTIDGKEFAHGDPRKLTLGTVDEWKLTALQAHPFHIHVNPFEVLSIKEDATGQETLEAPVWRDTIVIRQGFTIRMRTRYEDFSGVFVQHCHILDHEDQGMMQLVEVVDPNGGPAVATKLPDHGSSTPGTVNGNSLQVTEPYRATSWKLPDSTGTVHSLGEFQKDATVLFFFQGHGCLHCAEQITAFSTRADEFQKLGVRLVGISTDSVDSLRTALESAKCRFPLVADPQNLAFRDYNCFDGKPLHGTFVLDSELNVRWQLVSTEPFMSVDTVLAVTRKLIASRKQSISSNQTKDVNNE